MGRWGEREGEGEGGNGGEMGGREERERERGTQKTGDVLGCDKHTVCLNHNISTDPLRHITCIIVCNNTHRHTQEGEFAVIVKCTLVWLSCIYIDVLDYCTYFYTCMQKIKV